jgi:hypothetical protein
MPQARSPADNLHRREPCEPSTSSPLADLGLRLALERIYQWSQEPACGALCQLPGPPTVLLVTLEDSKRNKEQRSDDYFANVGDAIRSLREDIPLLFQRDLNCESRVIFP